jgi:GTP-binding protein EngB required for normal cell division
MNFRDNVNKATEILKNINITFDDKLDYPESINDLSNAIKFAVFGSYSVGKSTFINSFVFKERVLPSGIGEITKKTVLFSYSHNLKDLFNKKPFDFNELEKLLKSSTEPLNEVQINNSNLKEYTVVDMPGYGGIAENDLEEIIKKGCNEADAIFFIFDIAKGLSGNDKERSETFISHFLKENSKTQIWIIFNRLDAEEDKTENQICNLIAETLHSLNIISEIEKENLDSYEKLAEKKAFALSAKKSLDGYCQTEIKAGIEKPLSKERANEILEESRMLFFKEKFTISLEKVRIETFVFRLNKNIEYIHNELNIYEKNLDEKIKEKNELEKILSYKFSVKSGEIDFILSTKQKITDELKKIEQFLVYVNDDRRQDDILELKKELLNVYENCLIESISRYQLVGGSSKEQLIEKGIKNANEKAKPTIEKFVEKLVIDFVKNHSCIQNSILTFNEKNSGNQLIALEPINNQANISNENKFSNVTDTMFNEIALEIAGVISSIVAGTIMLFFETRLATLLIPGIGWALASIGLAYSLWSTATLGEKIAEKVKPELKKSLYIGEFPEKLTKTLHEQIIGSYKNKALSVVEITKNDIQILSRLSAKNEDERVLIENEMKESLAERNSDINNYKSKISTVKSKLETLEVLVKTVNF